MDPVTFKTIMTSGLHRISGRDKYGRVCLWLRLGLLLSRFASPRNCSTGSHKYWSAVRAHIFISHLGLVNAAKERDGPASFTLMLDLHGLGCLDFNPAYMKEVLGPLTQTSLPCGEKVVLFGVPMLVRTLFSLHGLVLRDKANDAIIIPASDEDVKSMVCDEDSIPSWFFNKREDLVPCKDDTQVYIYKKCLQKEGDRFQHSDVFMPTENDHDCVEHICSAPSGSSNLFHRSSGEIEESFPRSTHAKLESKQLGAFGEESEDDDW